ncbi:unnamed protein product [Boreogadus saida]
MTHAPRHIPRRPQGAPDTLAPITAAARGPPGGRRAGRLNSAESRENQATNNDPKRGTADERRRESTPSHPSPRTSSDENERDDEQRRDPPTPRHRRPHRTPHPPRPHPRSLSDFVTTPPRERDDPDRRATRERENRPSRRPPPRPPRDPDQQTPKLPAPCGTASEPPVVAFQANPLLHRGPTTGSTQIREHARPDWRVNTPDYVAPGHGIGPPGKFLARPQTPWPHNRADPDPNKAMAISQQKIVVPRRRTEAITDGAIKNLWPRLIGPRGPAGALGACSGPPPPGPQRTPRRLNVSVLSEPTTRAPEPTTTRPPVHHSDASWEVSYCPLLGVTELRSRRSWPGGVLLPPATKQPSASPPRSHHGRTPESDMYYEPRPAHWGCFSAAHVDT